MDRNSLNMQQIFTLAQCNKMAKIENSNCGITTRRFSDIAVVRDCEDVIELTSQ